MSEAKFVIVGLSLKFKYISTYKYIKYVWVVEKHNIVLSSVFYMSKYLSTVDLWEHSSLQRGRAGFQEYPFT